MEESGIVGFSFCTIAAMVDVEPLMFVTTLGTLFGLGVNLDVTLVEPLCDGDGKVGEVDMLVHRAGPSLIATCS